MALWFFVLLLSSLVTVHVVSQIDSLGFISIDCGLDANTSYVDTDTGLTYVSDDQFIDTGENHKISSKYNSDSLFKQSLTVRSFPNGARNCYTLRFLTTGSKYLLRATFLYGNYDNLNKFPTFDVYFGVDLWGTVEVEDPEDDYFIEIIAFARANYMQVCLVNNGRGTPFISELDLRPLNNSIYPFFNSSEFLILDWRLNLGASNNPLIRYPEDPFDRIWINYTDPSLKEISTTLSVSVDPTYQVPSAVMQTACVPSSTSGTLNISWNSTNISSRNYIALHFSELRSSSGKTQFNIYLNGDNQFPSSTFSPGYLSWNWAKIEIKGYSQYDLSLKSTASATLPPILNAMQVFDIESVTSNLTYDGDVTAINSIKDNYRLSYKGWSGDPCLPANIAWSGVSCTYSPDSPRITKLNVSSSGLAGAFVSAFGGLNALSSLDLSRNKLSGQIPDALDQLTQLKFLDLSGNKLDGSLPPGLKQKVKDGTLDYRNVDISNSCSDDNSCHSKKKSSPLLIIVIVVAVVVVLIIVVGVILICCILKQRKSETVNPQQQARDSRSPPPANYPPGVLYANIQNVVHSVGNDRNVPFRIGPPGDHRNTPPTNFPARVPHENVQNVNNPIRNVNNHVRNVNNSSRNNQARPTSHRELPIHNKQFSYREIVAITDNLQRKIGSGGFGNVYVGRLQNGTHVAVKLRSDSSKQGVKEFTTEAQNLAKVHHRNLVSLVGYCYEEDNMALVYEFMSEGTLQDKLRGLEYLHKSCNPPLLHRDVKSSNILLTPNLDAKIADFGLAKAFGGDATQNPTRIVGTPGYLDPEYYQSAQPTEKSDVYSFGVVLLEIITGQPPISQQERAKHISQLVQERLSNGDIESIIDARMPRQYDINSVWKVADMALQCTDKGSKRPTMSRVVAGLEESIKLQNSSEGTTNWSSNYSRNDNLASEVSQSTTFEMAYMGDMRNAPGPTTR